MNKHPTPIMARNDGRIKYVPTFRFSTFPPFSFLALQLSSFFATFSLHLWQQIITKRVSRNMLHLLMTPLLMNQISTLFETMQVKLIKEKKDMYYAEAIGLENVFAQGKNPQDTLQNLFHVYEMMQGHPYTSTINQQHMSQLNTLDFTSITLDV